MSSRISAHKNQSAKVLEHLAGWGVPSDVQQRLGAFGVLWSVFESTLEPTVWALTNECVSGVRPSTDRTSISDWIDKLEGGYPSFDPSTQDLVRISALAARDLMDYRHALAHGWLLPFPSGAIFIRNPSWNGEVRKRSTNDAHVDANSLDMAIDCVWTLCQVVERVRLAVTAPEKGCDLLELKNQIFKAKSAANELRNLTALMNYEKY